MDFTSLKFPEAVALRLYEPETSLSIGTTRGSMLLASAFAENSPLFEQATEQGGYFCRRTTVAVVTIE